MNSPLFDLTVRVGCHLVYQAAQPMPIVLMVRPHSSLQTQILQEKLTFFSGDISEQLTDEHGNVLHRWVMPPGETVIHHDALVAVSSLTDDYNRRSFVLPVEQLPPEIWRYTLPSRYCDTDKMATFATQQFGNYATTLDKVIAICNWIHWNIQYVTGSGRPDLSASDVLYRGYGVCRDFAHLGVTLCRALNIPARYVSGHLPDIGVHNPGTPMDFHAYFEAYLGNQWCAFDARFNVPRMGRVKIAQGLDAVDGALTTTYGNGALVSFEAWAFQVNSQGATLEEPWYTAQAKRLDGTPLIRSY